MLSDTTLTTKRPSLEEIKRNSTKRTKTNVNHTWVHSAQNDQLKDDIGKIGEQAVFKYLTEKYTESDYEIIPISSNLAGKKGNDTAKFEIFKENSLKNANYQALDFFVSV